MSRNINSLLNYASQDFARYHTLSWHYYNIKKSDAICQLLDDGIDSFVRHLANRE